MDSPKRKIWSSADNEPAGDGWEMVEIVRESAVYLMPPGASFEKEDPYAGMFFLQYIGRDEVYVSSLCGPMWGALFQRIVAWLFSRGIKRIRYRHKRKDMTIDGGAA